MYKFFVYNNQIKDNKIVITNSDVNHIKNVLRLQVLDLIYVCSKDTHSNYLCEIEKMDDVNVTCTIKEEILDSTETKTYVHVFQGLPKSEKLEYIIEKCTEIGVKEITPVAMERSIVKLDETAKNKKKLRWNKIAEVASKQSKRDEILVVNDVINFSDMFEKVKNYDILLLAYEEESETTLKHVLQNIISKDNNLKIAVLIGPEGGISEYEANSCIQNNFKSVTLGKRILRTETASIVIASNILYELEET